MQRCSLPLTPPVSSQGEGATRYFTVRFMSLFGASLASFIGQKLSQGCKHAIVHVANRVIRSWMPQKMRNRLRFSTILLSYLPPIIPPSNTASLSFSDLCPVLFCFPSNCPHVLPSVLLSYLAINLLSHLPLLKLHLQSFLPRVLIYHLTTLPSHPPSKHIITLFPN